MDLPDLAATAALGAAIAARVRVGAVVALSGGLGAGKTTLARAILAALGHDGEVPSPSFAILELYEAPPLPIAVVHADFYRLKSPAEVDELGLDDYRGHALLIAEWPENAGGFGADPACLSVAIEAGITGRWAIVSPGAEWLSRMP